ncbi:MAG: hypothetical protein U0869_16495 [Chloroflexota bacterium]
MDPASLFERVKREIEAHGGTVTGNPTAMRVKVPTPIGSVEGNVDVVAPNRVSIEVTRKPLVVSCGMVRDKIKEYVDRGRAAG